MSLQSFIDVYGYPAIAFGTFLEGETVLLLGGIAAKLGYLKLQWVIASAFVGSCLGDQLYFLAGRRHGRAFAARWPRWGSRIAGVQGRLERHRVPLLIGFRFLYGLRSALPFAIGMSSVPTSQFVLLNVVGALLWATVLGSAGYALGQVADQVLGHLRRYEVEVLVTVAALGGLAWLVRLGLRSRRRPRNGVRR